MAGIGNRRTRSASPQWTPRGTEETELTIERLVAGGEGLGHMPENSRTGPGKVVFVPGVLPGERVRVRLTGAGRDFSRARLTRVLEPSPDRVEPVCALAGTCGGCDWMHIDHGAQGELKKSIVAEALRRIGRLDAARIPMDFVKGPPLGYRNRVQIHRDAEGRFGFLGRDSHRFTAVPSCPVCVPALNRLFQAPFAGEGDRFTAFSDGDWTADGERDADRDLAVTLRGRGIRFSVGCFFQSNLAMLDGFLGDATEDLSGGAACDLFCGVGLFGAFLRDRFRTVVCVESQQTALDYARRNVAGSAHEFYPLDAETWARGPACRLKADAVVADPPRTGLPAAVREAIARMAPRDLVYVSCDPVTLSRDLGHLASLGFRLERIRLFDFYPQTAHIETVARLRS